MTEEELNFDFFSKGNLNEHILIHGTTKSGKTELLMRIVQAMSAQNIPSFVTDLKGECISLLMDVEDECRYPIELWDLRGEEGLPLRTSVSDLGPTLLARMLELNQVQEGLLRLCFRMEDENGYLLLDITDLQALLAFIQAHPSAVPSAYGQVSMPTLAAITRRIMKLEDEGLAACFGEPALDFQDLFASYNSRGKINILNCERIAAHKSYYQAIMLWLLSSLIDTLPETNQLQFILGIELKDSFFIDEAVLSLLQKRGIILLMVANKVASNLPETVRVIEAAGRAHPILRRSMRIDEESALYRKYKQEVDRFSAKEMLEARTVALESELLIAESSQKKKRFPFVERIANAAASTVGRELGREFSRGILDVLKRKR